MKKKLLILAGMFMIIQFGHSNACGMRYKLGKDKVYYYQNFVNNSEIKEADYKTFEVMTNVLAKDKNYVYYLGEKVKGINPETFKIINEENEELFDCAKTSYVLEDNGKQVFLKFDKLKRNF